MARNALRLPGAVGWCEPAVAIAVVLREVDFLRALRDYASRERRWGR